MKKELTWNELYSLCIKYEIEKNRIMNLATDNDKLLIIDTIDEINKYKPLFDLIKMKEKYIYKDISKKEIKKDIEVIDNIKQLYYYYN